MPEQNKKPSDSDQNNKLEDDKQIVTETTINHWLFYKKNLQWHKSGQLFPWTYIKYIIFGPKSTKVFDLMFGHSKFASGTFIERNKN